MKYPRGSIYKQSLAHAITSPAINDVDFLRVPGNFARHYERPKMRAVLTVARYVGVS